jgi:hypothetical protein
VFRMDVVKVDPDVAHVAMAIYVCCKSLFKMFHLFYTYVANVITGGCICCNGFVTSVFSKRFICFQTYVAIVFILVLQK